MSLLRCSVHKAPSLVAAIVLTLGAADASARERVGSEFSAAVLSVVRGSNSVHMLRRAALEVFERGASYAVCDPANDAYCPGPHSSTLTMNTFPRWQLRVHLPHHLSLQGHLWSMSHQDAHLTIRQAIVGTTLRHMNGRHWYEIGFGMAERAEVRGETTTSVGPGPVVPALIAGVGTQTSIANHMFFDLSLRAGVDIGDASADVYHMTLSVAFLWQ